MIRKGWMTFGLIMVLSSVLLSACGGAAAGQAQPTLAPVVSNSGIIAEGRAVPVEYANLSFAANGIVSEVLVAEGQSVQKDAVIARLKGSERAEAAVAAAQLELLNAQQALDELLRNAQVATAAAQLKLAQAAKEYDDKKEDRESKAYRPGDDNQIDIARAELLVAEEHERKAEEVYGYFEGLDEDNLDRAATMTMLAQTRQARYRAEANLNYLLNLPESVDVQVAEGEFRVAEANMAAAQRDYDRVKVGVDPEKQALAEARVQNAQAQLASANAALDDLQLKAPFAGVVVTNALKVGELVSPGASTVTVADLSDWKIETTDLTELNVVSLSEGMPAAVTVDAIPDMEMTGVIEKINQLGVNSQGDITYKVTIDLDQPDSRLRWNMTTAVNFQP